MENPENTQQEIVPINTIDQFAHLVAHWHHNRMGQLAQAHQAPDEVEITAVLEQGGEEIVLTSEQRKGFRAGLVLAASLFGELPFTVTQEPVSEAQNGQPAEELHHDQPN